ncbi:MAG: YdcF family protein [Hyphomicrobium sp.]
MFYISKLVWLLLQPSMLIVVLLIGGVVLLGTRFQRTARTALIGAAALTVIGGILPLSTWLILPLEERFPRADLSGPPIDGIVILGGAEEARVANGRHVHALNMAAERMTEGAALARRFPNARVVFTGGSTNIVLGPAVEADAAATVLHDLGLEPHRLKLEREARNTLENAIYAKQLAGPKPGERWLLVTSAWHMPRAMGLFRKAGFDLEAWPVDYRTAGADDAFVPFYSPSEGLRRLDTAMREWVGLLANRITGQSDELFPAP